MLADRMKKIYNVCGVSKMWRENETLRKAVTLKILEQFLHWFDNSTAPHLVCSRESGTRKYMYGTNHVVVQRVPVGNRTKDLWEIKAHCGFTPYVFQIPI